MRARCTACNHAIEFTHQKGVKLSDSKCLCGGDYKLMRSRQVEGDAPVSGFTHELFGRKYHVVYSGVGGEWLWDRVGSRFVSISDLGSRNADLIKDASAPVSITSK